MRIVYGVSGEGLGHATRAKRVIEHLKSKKHEVLIITYGQAYNYLKNLNEINILKTNGIKVKYKEGKLKLKKTIVFNIKNIFYGLLKCNYIRKILLVFSPDVFISDMEPISARMAKIFGVPLISFDNQHSLILSEINVPKRYFKDYLLAKVIIKKCVPSPDFYIIISFSNNEKKGKNIYFVHPVIRKDIINLKSKKKNYVLVYLSKKNEKIFQVLKKINEKFIVYSEYKTGTENNLIFKKISEGFKDDLANAKAVIANSGFSLISESLYLKKPYFAIPLIGQFEQMFNATLLKNAGYGDYSEKPTFEEIKNFLINLKIYENRIKKYKINKNSVFEALDIVLKKTKNQKS